MSERRQKIGSILLKIQGKTLLLELFPAEQWPDGAPGLFRVRCDGAWLARGDEKQRFFNFSGLGVAVVAALHGELGIRPDERPEIVRGMWITAPVGSEVEGAGRYLTRTRVLAGPIQGLDGRWRVYVTGWPDPVLVEECERWGW